MLNLSSPGERFNQQLDTLVQKGKRTGKFKDYLSVKEKEGKVYLITVGLFTAFLEKAAGFFRGRDLTNAFLVEAVALDFLERNQEFINGDNRHKVQDLVRRIGLVAGNPKSRKAPLQLHRLLEKVSTPAITEPLKDLSQQFQDLHKKELLPYQTILQHLQWQGQEAPPLTSRSVAPLQARQTKAETISIETSRELPDEAEQPLSAEELPLKEHSVSKFETAEKTSGWGKTALKAAGALFAVGIAALAYLYRTSPSNAAQSVDNAVSTNTLPLKDLSSQTTASKLWAEPPSLTSHTLETFTPSSASDVTIEQLAEKLKQPIEAVNQGQQEINSNVKTPSSFPTPIETSSSSPAPPAQSNWKQQASSVYRYVLAGGVSLAAAVVAVKRKFRAQPPMGVQATKPSLISASSGALPPLPGASPIYNAPPLHPPPDWHHFKAETYAPNLFALMHLDFMNLDTKEMGGNATIALPFFIQQLDQALNDPKLQLSEQERTHIQDLMRSYEFTYATACWQQQLSKLTDPQEILDCKRAIKESIMHELKSRGTATISTGYRDSPAGHEISFELILEKGNRVRGEVVNRGEGIRWHQADPVGNKEKRQTVLALLPTPLKQLENSSFLDCMLDLSFLSVPSLNGPQPTLYGIEDFYEGLLPLWPRKGSKIAYADDTRFSRTPQRGPTCYGKAHLTTMKNKLEQKLGKTGKALGNYLKFRMKLAILHIYTQTQPIDDKNQLEILESVAKTNRSALKLNDNEVIQEREWVDEAAFQELSHFSSGLQLRVKAAMESFKEVTAQQKLQWRAAEPFTHLFTVPEGRPFAFANVAKQNVVQYHLPDSSNLQNMAALTQFLKDSCQQIQKLKGYSLIPDVDAVEYATRALMKLPSCQAPIWEILSTSDLDRLITLQEMLLWRNASIVGPKITTPEEACLHLKCFAITLQASKLDPALVTHILRRVPTYFRKTPEGDSPLYHAPTSVKLSQEMAQAYAIINKHFQGRAVECSTNASNTTYDEEKYESLSEALINPELNYVNDQIKGSFLSQYEHLAKVLEVAGEWHKPEHAGIVSTNYKLIKKQLRIVMTSLFIRGNQIREVWHSCAYELSMPRFGIKEIFYPNVEFTPKFLPLLHSQGLNEEEAVAYQEVRKARRQNIHPLCKIDFPRALNVSQQEQNELLSISCQTDLSIPQLIHYFKKHSNRFKDGFFRTLFTSTLFQLDETGRSAIQNCMEDEGRAVQLFRFLKRASAKAVTTNTFSTQCFLLKARIHALVFLVHANQKSNHLLKQELREVKKEIERMLKSTDNRVLQSALAHTLVACYPSIQEAESIQEVLAPFCISAYQSIETEGYVYEFKRDIENDEYDRSPQFKEDFEKGKFDLRNEVGINQASVLLPERIVKDEFYRQSFSTIYPAEKKGNVYEFVDDHNHHFRAQIHHDGTFSFYIQKNKEWYERNQPVYPLQELQKCHPCYNRDRGKQGMLTMQTSCWSKVGAHPGSREMIMLSPDFERIVATVTNQAIKKGAASDQPPLFLATDYENDPLISHLSRLTRKKKDQILLWKKQDGNLCSCEIPSLKLSFHKEVTDTGEVKWVSDNYPGYFLDTQMNHSSLHPLDHYILLKNQKGKQMAVMPSRIFLHRQPEFGSFPQLISMERNDKFANEHLCTYVLGTEGAIQLPHDVNSLLYLVYIALVKRDYQLAQQVFKELKKMPEMWSDTAKEIFQSLMWENRDRADLHPYAIALRLQIALMAFQSVKGGLASLSRSRYVASILKVVQMDYMSYLDQLNNMGSFALQEEEELACMQLCKGSHDERIRLRKRQMEVSQGSAEIVSYDQPYNSEEEMGSFGGVLNHYYMLNQLGMPKILHHADHPLPTPIKMRVEGTVFASNFLYYYKIAKSSDKQAKRELKELLQASRNSRGECGVQYLRLLLLHMLDSPSRFPPFEKICASAEAGTLTKTLDAITKRLPGIDRKFQTPTEWTFAGNFSVASMGSKIKKAMGLGLSRSAKTSELLQATRPVQVVKPLAELPVNPIHPIDLGEYFCDVPVDVIQMEIATKKGFLARLKEVFTKTSQALEEEVKEKETRIPFVADQAIDPNITSLYREKQAGITAMEKELTELGKSIQGPQKTVDLSKTQEIADELSSELQRLDGELKQWEGEIIKIAHNYPLLESLQVNAGLLTPLTIQDMMVHFGREDDQAFFNSNPSLKEKDVQEIKKLLRFYLLMTRERQQRERLAESVASIQGLQAQEDKVQGQIQTQIQALAAQPDQEEALKAIEASKDKLTSIRTSIEAERREFMNLYRAVPCDPANPPYLLAFEVISKVMVRRDQYDKLMKIAMADENEVLEAATGFGKSKVVIPLWLYLTSRFREGKITMMVCPGALLEQQVEHLKKTLGKTYSKGILQLNMSREESKDLGYLQWLNARLAEAGKKNTLVIADIHTYHHLTDLCQKENELDPFSEAVTKELKVLKEHVQRLFVFFDESADSLDNRHYYDNSHGKPKPVELAHCQAVGKLYEHVILPEESVAFEFLPREESEAAAVGAPAVMNEARYNQLLPSFARRVMSLFKVGEEDFPAIAQDLQNGKYTQACDRFHDILTASQLKEYAIFKQQLNVYLKRSLNRNAGEQYGFSKLHSHRFAVPCLRGKVNEKSEFATIDDLLNLTTQVNLKEPLRLRDIRQFIDHLKMADPDDPLTKAQIEVWNQIQVQLQIKDLSSFMDAQTHHFPMIQTLLNDPKNRLLKLNFIVNVILPQITLYERKVTSSAYNIASATSSWRGASATNVSGLLPEGATVLADPKASVENLLPLMEHSQKQIYVVEDPKNSQEKLRLLLKQYPDYTVFIDVDGSFREMAPEAVARTILEVRDAQDQIEGVSFYDHNGKNMLLLRGSTVPIPMEREAVPLDKIFTFIPQSGVIGSDPPISLQGKGLVTMNRMTGINLFTQGIGRLRGLSKGQQVGIVMNRSDAAIIQAAYPESSKTPSLMTLLRYMTDQEGIQLGKDYFLAVRQKLENALEIYLKEHDMERYKQFITKTTQIDHLSKLKENLQSMPARQAVWHLVESVVREGFEDSLSQEAMRSMCEELLTQVKVNYELLPHLISLYQGDEIVSSVEVEAAEGEAVEEASAESDVQQENMAEAVEEASRQVRSYDPAIRLVWHYQDILRKHEYSPDFPGIKVSPNFLRIAANGRDIGIQKPAYQYLITHDPITDQYEMTLLDLYDADLIAKQMRAAKQPSAKNYYLYSGDEIIQSDARTAIAKTEWSKNPQLLTFSIMRKLRTGDMDLIEAERDFIKRQDPVWKNALLREIEASATMWPRMGRLKVLIQNVAPKYQRIIKSIHASSGMRRFKTLLSNLWRGS